MANIYHFVILSCLMLGVVAYHGADLPPGPYCGLSNQCCSSRHDDCSHEILDTLCYCDDFCNRTINDDCCPDYEEVCLGIYTPPPPPSTTTPPPQNQIIQICQAGQTKMSTCNLCTCITQPNGENDWACEDDKCLIDNEVIFGVNQGGTTWRAANYTEFYTKKLKDGLVYRLGTLPLRPETRHLGFIRHEKPSPAEFDSRQRWPGYVSPIVDQGWCGADWAVVVAGVTSDRLAIQSKGAETVVLGPQTILSCSHLDRGQDVCQGGHIDVAWPFAMHFGLVDEVCYPYTASASKCKLRKRGSLQQAGCVPSTPTRTARYKVGPAYRLKTEQDIMYDITESGPVHAIMTVYQDFFHYRDGVYRRSYYGDGAAHGLHSVRIVGWGEDGGDRYWTVANSWGRNWGENGYFRIARGTNESGIESFIVTALAEISEAYKK